MGNFLDRLPAGVLGRVCNPRHICIQGNYFLFIMNKAQVGPHQLTTEQMDAQAGMIVHFPQLSLLLRLHSILSTDIKNPTWIRYY